MARSRKPLNYRDMAENIEAYERRKAQLDEEIGGETAEAEDDDEEVEADAEAEVDADADPDSDVEEAPKPKKKKAKKPAGPAKPRTRAVKVVRMKVVWVVRDNSNKVIDTFPYNQRAAAEALVAEKMSGEKKGLFFVQREKVEMDG
jgi:hypothetical protein